MDRDFEKKVKQKKIRQIAVCAVVLVAVAYLLFTLNIERVGAPVKEAVTEGNPIEVSLEIRCDSISQDMDRLEDPTLAEYVPEDGVILPETKVKVKDGATVFDVLNKVCREKEIHVESSYTPAYESYYVEGINYLYEFDAGELSGWMFCVNEKYPNYGCSEYTLKEGDRIQWLYTCDLGKDIGGDKSASGKEEIE